MSRKTVKILFWICLGLIFVFGPVLNLMMDKDVALNFALDRMFQAPLPVRAYFMLLAILTFVVGEISLGSVQQKNRIYPLVMVCVLLAGYAATQYLYFVLLIFIGLVMEAKICWDTRQKKDAITEVLETVMAAEVSEEDEEIDVMEEILEENEEPEVALEAEETLDDMQQKEIDHFLDSLFEKKSENTDEQAAEEETEPLVKEILSDTNDILEMGVYEEVEDIKKEPPKAVFLEKEPVFASDDLLEEEMAKKEEPLGEFDEEIPLDDFVN